MNKRPHSISIPVELIEPCEETGGQYFIANSEETLKKMGTNMQGFGVGSTVEEAEAAYIDYTIRMGDFHRKKVDELEKLAIFTRGSWRRRGSYWFTVLGICFNFRYGNNMIGGWYVPFTKLNISIFSYWKRPKK